VEHKVVPQNGNVKHVPQSGPEQWKSFLRDELKPVPQKTAVPQNFSPVPQKKQPVLRDDLIDDDDLEDDFQEIRSLAGWRVERRFYTKKDGTIMLYWNYRSRNPVYINGKREIKYKTGGKKVWQAAPTKTRTR
jgi:hypothetical protein